MKNFEMPKMNISIFSEENIVTESAAKLAQQALVDKGVTVGNITSTTDDAGDWIDA